MPVEKAGECCHERAFVVPPLLPLLMRAFHPAAKDQLIKQQIIEDAEAQIISAVAASGSDITQVGYSGFNEYWGILFDPRAALDKFKGP